jgi:hypothetical protein
MNLTRNLLRISLLALTFSTTTDVQAQDKTATSQNRPPLATNLLGTWILVGKPGEIGEPPKAGGRLKFFTGRHWVITQADPETGVTIFHHGGTYTLNDDKYAETIEYANENTKELIKQTFQFTIKVEGDTLTQIGIGNPWTEVWKRAK